MRILSKTKNWLALIIAFLISWAAVNANFSTTVVASTSDGIDGAFQIRDDGLVNDTTGHTLLGTFDSEYYHSVFVFQMPDFPKYQNYHLQASLSFAVNALVGSPGLIDLVGMRASTSRAVSGADFDSVPDVTILSGVHFSNIFTGRNNDTLNTWINANYAVGEYLVLGVRTQTEPAPVFNYVYLPSNSTLTLVPEIPTYALIICSAAFTFVMIRYRRKD